jgi:hypothetical protein
MKADLEDPNFMQGMQKLLGMDDEAVEKLLDDIEADDLMALTDAIAKQDAETAKAIVERSLKEVNALFDKNKKSSKPKKTPTKPPKDHEFAYGDDVAIKTTNEDTGEDDFVSATVYRPTAPGDTVGVKIEGKLKMVDRDEVYTLNEMVLGMTGIPSIERMQQLAGIPGMAPPPPDTGVEVTQVEPHQGVEGAVQRAMCALDELESALPDIRLADLKAVRARLNDMQTKMNESVTLRMPEGRPRKS